VLVCAMMTGNFQSGERLPNTQGSSVITELMGICICAACYKKIKSGIALCFFTHEF